MIKGEAWLQGYRQQHTATIEALRSNTTQSIKDLCEQSKNDAQINQEIQDSVQELLQKLEDNKIENQEKKKSTNQVQYKDFFDENQKKALQEIQHTNEWWINTMLDIRGKGNYTPERYINDMFNQFYGNSGDFIDLHK
jgi:nucleotidyltransferase/DNA polymerase involved in DNA repair